jgi:integration host factor subunit beta
VATITKQDLVYRISERMGQKKVVTKQIIQSFIDEIVRELERGNRLEFREFGVFELKERAARKARNPQTGDSVYVPAKKVVHFKPGRKMKEVVGDSSGAHEQETASARAASDPVDVSVHSGAESRSGDLHSGRPGN